MHRLSRENCEFLLFPCGCPVDQFIYVGLQFIVTMEKVAILDAGAQYGKVIDRRVRELGIGSDFLQLDTPARDLREYGAIIISGGPGSVYAPGAPRCDPAIFSAGVPILGICYGMQLMNHMLGGTVAQQDVREDSQRTITISQESELFRSLTAEQDVLLTHGDAVQRLAPGFAVSATSEDRVVAIEDSSKKLFGVQFHPEVELTVNGKVVFKNFLLRISDLEPTLRLADSKSEAIKEIRECVGEDDVLVLVSGGVDSTVLAALLAQALPSDQIHAIHIDTGLMRAQESAQVKQALASIGVKVEVIDAKLQFLTASDGSSCKLQDATDPELKRRIIGDTFVKVAQQAIARRGLDVERTFLAQGTLRPDLIESASHLASGQASTIKTHHNDTPLVRALRERGRVVEPLKDLHKDEVRQLGRDLGLPAVLVDRHPFPGPGLAVRIICAQKPFVGDGISDLQAQVDNFSRAFSSHLLPVRSVGVQGDGRSYKHVVALTGPKDWAAAFELARRIPRKVHGVSRVIYLFGQGPGGRIGITPTFLRDTELALLREADRLVNERLLAAGCYGLVDQFPVVLLPADMGIPGCRTLVLRPFITNDFMTGRAAVPGKDIPDKVIEDIVGELLELEGVVAVGYDLTSKPPGTVEWE